MLPCAAEDQNMQLMNLQGHANLSLLLASETSVFSHDCVLPLLFVAAQECS